MLITHSVWRDRDFRLLAGCGLLSHIGDHFTIVALPWLVLKVTGSPAALGTVLAAMAIPQALFILYGGAVVDSISPRKVLLASRAISAILLATLAWLISNGQMAPWMLYGFAVSLGIATAFAIPASASLLPYIVAKSQLQAANGIAMGTRQIAMFVGPLLAGVVIVMAPEQTESGIGDAAGLARAFVFDSLTFAVSVIGLSLIRRKDRPRKTGNDRSFRAVIDGLQAVWRDLPLRAMLLYASTVALLISGPLQVGMPLLAENRFALGAASLGALLTAHGGGMLIGNTLSSMAWLNNIGTIGRRILVFDGIAGVLLMILSQIESLSVALLLLFSLGLLSGFLQVMIMTWIQCRVPMERMGRTMSIVLFAFLGVAPLSAAATGLLGGVLGLKILLLGAGMVLSSIALLCLSVPAIREIGAPEEESGPVTSASSDEERVTT